VSDDESAPDPAVVAAGVSGGSGTLSAPAPLTATGASVSGGLAALSMAVGMTATGHAVSGGSATLTRREFRDLSVAAGRAALARLEAKQSGTPRDIFAEVAEVLFWLYALGDIVGKKRNQMRPGLRWTRTMHAHGWLLTEAVHVVPVGALATVAFAAVPLGGTQQHRWLPRTQIATTANARPMTYLAARYDRDVANRPVIDTLRDELNRLAALTGSRA
jgi:hypothetical protein